MGDERKLNGKHVVLVAECQTCQRLFLGCGSEWVECPHDDDYRGQPRSRVRTRRMILEDMRYGGAALDSFAATVLKASTYEALHEEKRSRRGTGSSGS